MTEELKIGNWGWKGDDESGIVLVKITLKYGKILPQSANVFHQISNVSLQPKLYI